MAALTSSPAKWVKDIVYDIRLPDGFRVHRV
jgi:hypothetical protein